MTSAAEYDAPLASGRSAPDEPSLSVLLLCATLTAAVVGQGAFYGPTRWLVAAGLAAATLFAFLGPRRPARSLGALPWIAAALAAWALIRGFGAGNVASGFGQSALIAGVGAVVQMSRRWTQVERDLVITALFVIGGGVALSGWIGAAFRLDRWALEGETTWRASATLTYPNSAAAVLVAVVLIALGRMGGSARSSRLSVLCALLLAGVGATQSRGGAVALVVGLAVLAAIGGIRPLVRSIGSPLLGAVVAVACLWPGLDPARDARPVLALAGLVSGIAVAALTTRMPVKHIAGLAAAGIVVAGVAVAIIGGPLGRLPTDRLRLAAGERGATTEAALDTVRSEPIAGVGPGNLRLSWRANGELLSTDLVHNEYLQLTAELGLVGAAVLLALGACVASMVFASRRWASPPTFAGSAAALAALAVHSAFDFLWHITAIPLLAATMFGLCWSENSTFRATELLSTADNPKERDDT